MKLLRASDSVHGRVARGPVGWCLRLACLLLCLSVVCPGQGQGERPSPSKVAEGLMSRGRYAEALSRCREALAEPGCAGGEAATLLSLAVQSLRTLNRRKEGAQLVEEEVNRRPADWPFLAKAHRTLRQDAAWLDSSTERRRQRWLRWLSTGVAPVADGSLPAEEQALFWGEMMSALREGRTGLGHFWRLQVLTSLEPEAGPDEGTDEHRQPWGGWAQGLPLSSDGGALFFRAPRSWTEAANDGERYAWCLARLLALLPASGAPQEPNLRQALREHADTCLGVYGEQALPRPLLERQDGGQDWTKTLAALEDGELLVALATGRLLRTAAPPEWHPLWLLGRLDDIRGLAVAYEARGQYGRAAAMWRRLQEDGATAQRQEASRMLERLEGAWCQLLEPRPGMTQLAGQPVRLRLRYRNAAEATLTAQQVNVAKLVEDWRKDGASRRSEPLGLLRDPATRGRYLRRQVASWRERLAPLPGHRDTMAELTAPLREPGTYLVTCTVDGGRSCLQLTVVRDRVVLLSQDGPEQPTLQLLDAASGQPIPNGEIEFLEDLPASKDGPRRQGRQRRQERLLSGTDGLIRLPKPAASGRRPSRRLFWTLAKATNGELLPGTARHLWLGGMEPVRQERLRGYAMFDRGLYRPGHKIHARIWLERGEQALPEGTRLSLRMAGPQGGEVMRREAVADAAGGVSLDWTLPPESRLGWHSLSVSMEGDGGNQLHVGGFRVEAYRKPDFEVSLDLPDEPPKLGGKVEAIVRAAYYFGAPVADGQLRLTVTRRRQQEGWHWPSPWDWLYPRHRLSQNVKLDCLPPSSSAPETVLRTSGTLGADGTFRVTLDTAEALSLYGDSAHVYDFQAEVEDAGRRVIQARQSLTLSPRPFETWIWPDRDFALVGEPVQVRLQARTAQGRPVTGEGTLRLFRLAVQPDGTVAETHERSWTVAPDAEGRASQTLSASRPGRYRLSWSVTARGETVTGNAQLHVFGDGYDGRDFQCRGLEATADRHEYAVGDTARILVTAEQSGSVVMMLRSGAPGKPQPVRVLRLTGRSQLVEVPVLPSDVPAATCVFYLVRDGVLHRQAVSLAVPPVESLLQVKAQAEPATARPGDDCRLRLRVTDSQGRPAASTQLVVTVYDRSLEALAGGAGDRLQRLFGLIGLRQHLTEPEVGRLDGAHWMMQGFYDRPEQRMDWLNLTAAPVFPGWPGVNMSRHVMALNADASIDVVAMKRESGLNAAAPAMAGAAAQPDVPRTRFADTALWRGDAVTDGDGQVTLAFRLPDNVTSWRVHVWAKDGHRRVGVGETSLQTAKPLIVRPLSPRFLVASDEAVLGATVHNALAREVAVQVTLTLPEALLALESGTATHNVRVPAGGSVRTEWRVRVKAPGMARWTVAAMTAEGIADGVGQSLPVRVYGAERQESFCGVLREGQPSAELAFEVPARRLPETMRLDVTWTPSLAQCLLAAMPYLLAEPEGCTERTVSRLTSLLRVRQTLTRLKLPLRDVAKATAASPSTTSPAWRRTATMAVFDDDELARMTARGLAALAALQGADGGWGWYPGLGESSDPLMTALAVEGLLTARGHGVSVEPMLTRGLDWLERRQRDTLKSQKRQAPVASCLELDARLHQVLCLAGRDSDAMGERLWRERAKLSPYGLALFALAERTAGRRERLDELTSLLRQYVREDAETGMAWVDCGAFPHWLWQGDRIETQAACIRLLLAQPQPDLRLASALVAHLLANRRHATYWNSTRDTAACLGAIADYLLASGELAPDAQVELLLDGQKLAESRLDATRLWTEPLSFSLAGAKLTAGRHVLTLRRQGRGNLYYASRLVGFSQETQLLPAGLEAKVSRTVFRLEQTPGQATFLPDREAHPVPGIAPRIRRIPLRDGDAVSPGDLLEVRLTLDAKFDLEYLLLDDPRIAGAEPLDTLSGHTWQRLAAYRETRDDTTRFYLQRLPQGQHQLSYQLRVETPGRFCALPSQLKAVYAPDIRGNSDAIRLRVDD